MRRQGDTVSVVMCWSDVSTAIFTISTYASPDMFVNHVTFSFSQFITYRPLGSVYDAWLLLVAIKYNLTSWTIMADGEIGIRFRYFAMILFQTIMVFGEWVNLLQFKDTSRWFRHTISSLHHLHDLPNETVHGDCPIILCMGMRLAD